jgi:cell division septation protein DedD
LAQDDYYYEIQLTNKQLVFYFLAGATGLILSFLAGVMVGKGVDAPTLEARDGPVNERIVPEEPSELAPDELTYAQRLEDEKPRATLEPSPDRPSRGAAAVVSTPTPRATPAPTPRATPTPAPTPAPTATPAAATPAPAPGAAVGRVPPEAAGAFTIQVGAFKDRASAQKIMDQLEAKGFAAYVVTPEVADGLYNVRVGRYATRADADRVMTQLREKEKFKPFIVSQQ